MGNDTITLHVSRRSLSLQVNSFYVAASYNLNTFFTVDNVNNYILRKGAYTFGENVIK